jgi:hypothetical protein
MRSGSPGYSSQNKINFKTEMSELGILGDLQSINAGK